ncbi:hypothetical protein H6G91_39210 [Nostoc muscorum FACHB-395]|jgi:hypothetical protein|nr:hypothetical protein [Desmonostoc muscorum FACHB-395]
MSTRLRNNPTDVLKFLSFVKSLVIFVILVTLVIGSKYIGVIMAVEEDSLLGSFLKEVIAFPIPWFGGIAGFLIGTILIFLRKLILNN